MGDFLVLLHGLMKVMLVIAVIVLIATAPALADTPGREVVSGRAQTTVCDQDDKPSWGRRMLLANDDYWSESEDTSASLNVDGTPMAGDIDLNGNLFGCCSSDLDSWGGSTSSMWD